MIAPGPRGRELPVHFSPEALDQLVAIEEYIAQGGSPAVAARYVDAIVNYCESLSLFPQRGVRRDDVMPGLRVTNYRRNAVIAFVVDQSVETVAVVGVFYRGRDYARVLQDTSGDPDL